MDELIAFEKVYEAKVFERYEGICDNCAAPIAINDKFWAVLIAQDKDWDYHLLVNFLVYCFSCHAKLYILKTNRHPFEISSEFADMKVSHENR